MKNSRKRTKGIKRRKTLKTPLGAKGGVGKGREKVADAPRPVSASGSPAVRCPHCHHSLENNPHGFDQNDAWMEGDRLVHSGKCTYCKECSPRIGEALAKIEERKQLGSSWPCYTFLETPIYRKLGFSIDKRFYCLRIGKDGICFRDVFGKGEFLVGWAEIISIKSNLKK